MAKDKNHDKEIDLKNYRSEGGVSLESMNLGLWLAEHRRRIIKIIIAVLIILSAAFFIYSSYGYVIYFLGGQSGKLTTDTGLLSPRNVVSELEISPLQVFSNGEKFDLAVKLKNNNEKFIANFNYCFLSGEKEVDCASGFILPSEEKYVLALGQTRSDEGAITFKIKDIFWQRINAHQIPDWSAFKQDRLDFVYQGTRFYTANDSGLSEKISLNTLEFTITNASAYSYYEVPFNIMLYSGSELVGVHQYLLSQFLTGEKREIKISWPGNLSYVSRTEIVPNINITDDNVYLKYQGTAK